jgi:hypothetical protein
LSIVLLFSPQSAELQPIAIVVPAAPVQDPGLFITAIDMQGGPQEALVGVAVEAGSVGAITAAQTGRVWKLNMFTNEAVRSGLSPFPRNAKAANSSLPLRIAILNTTAGTLGFEFDLFWRRPIWKKAA